MNYKIVLHYLPMFEKHVQSSTSKIPNTILSYQTFNNKRFNAWLPANDTIYGKGCLYYTAIGYQLLFDYGPADPIHEC